MPTARAHEELPPVEELTPEESWAFFDERCQRMLGMSATEFMRKLRSGELVDDDEPENWKVGHLAMSVALFE